MADKIGEKIPIGTIASICGVELIKFNTTQPTSIELHGSAYWTRVYTQIYDSGMNEWYAWSSVAQVQTVTYISGDYYDTTTNRPAIFAEVKQENTIYSEHYNDLNWRKSQAAAGWTYSFPRSEFTGDAKIYYDDKAVFHFTEWTGLTYS